MSSPPRRLSIEMMVCVLPCTIFWVVLSPFMVLVLLRSGSPEPRAWLALWCLGGLYALIALWSALLDERSGQRATMRLWQWVGLGVGALASAGLVFPSFFGAPDAQLHLAFQIVVLLPVIAAVRLIVVRHR